MFFLRSDFQPVKKCFEKIIHHTQMIYTPVYARSQIEYLGDMFGMKTDDLVLEWAELFLSILTSPSWDILRTH